MRFANPWAFALAVLLPATVAFIAWRRRVPSAPYSDVRLAETAGSTWRTRSAFVPTLFRMACIALACVALARPQVGRGRTETTIEAVAIQVVIDRSESMGQGMRFGRSIMARLDVVKEVLAEFLLGNDDDLKGRRNDLIGLVAFATRAETICPAVRDPDIVLALARTLEPIRVQGLNATSIGDGLALAAARLAKLEETIKERDDIRPGDDIEVKSKLIILLTDGIDRGTGESTPLEAASLAEQWGIKVYPIGVGNPLEVDGPLLQEIAARTGGVYAQAVDGESLRRAYGRIDEMETSSVSVVEFTDFDERFMPWLLAAIGCLVAELLVRSAIWRSIP